MLFATLYLPNFFLQAALRHQPELAGHAVALIDERDAKPTFLQVNAEAAAAEVRCGMTPSQGLARYLPLVVKGRLLEQEKMLADLLLQFAFTLSPFVEATAPGICTVQANEGAALREKVERVLAQLQAAGLTAQAGIAPTPDTSFLAAHLANPLLQVEDVTEFLAPLPIETLAQG